jgi:uncharacterized protein
MRHAIVRAITILPVLAFLCSAGVSADAVSDGLIRQARRVLELLDTGDFAGAGAGFDAAMTKAVSPEKLGEIWKSLTDQLGGFKRQTGARTERSDPYEVVLVTCEFAKASLEARFVFGKDGRIAGFRLVPSLSPASYKTPGYADPALFEEKEVTVGSPDWPLPGTLTVPRLGGPFPAVVLVHGSGPNDRDESVGPNKPFKDIAWGLASRGIAVLRYEKRTRAFGSRLAADPVLGAELTVREETVDDAVAAVAFLQGTPGIDSRRVFVLGHSLGGMLVPRIGVAGKNLGIAGFVIMAGLTRPLEDTVVRQMTYILALDGSLSADDKSKIEDLKSQAAKVKAFTAKDSASGERFLYAPVAYWLDLKGYYPPDVAAGLSAPLLVLQGARDYQVTTDDFENWKKALGSKPRAAFRLYPKLNHLFFAGTGLPTPDEYTSVQGNVAPEVLEDIVAFIRS